MDLGEFAKNLQSLKIEEGDKMIELKFTLQKKLSIKAEEELKILVASNIRERIENWLKVCQQNNWQVQMFHVAANL